MFSCLELAVVSETGLLHWIHKRTAEREEGLGFNSLKLDTHSRDGKRDCVNLSNFTLKMFCYAEWLHLRFPCKREGGG